MLASYPCHHAGCVIVAPRLKPSSGMTTASSPGFEKTCVRAVGEATSLRTISNDCAGTLTRTRSPCGVAVRLSPPGRRSAARRSARIDGPGTDVVPTWPVVLTAMTRIGNSDCVGV